MARNNQMLQPKKKTLAVDFGMMPAGIPRSTVPRVCLKLSGSEAVRMKRCFSITFVRRNPPNNEPVEILKCTEI